MGNTNWICSQFHIVFWRKNPRAYQPPVYKNYSKRKYRPMQCISCSGFRQMYHNISENSTLFHRMGNMNWICSQLHIEFWRKKPRVYQLPVYKNYRKRKYGPMQCISCNGFPHVYHNILENSILFHRMGNMNWICSHKRSINAFWALLKLGPGQTNSWGHRGY